MQAHAGAGFLLAGAGLAGLLSLLPSSCATPLLPAQLALLSCLLVLQLAGAGLAVWAAPSLHQLLPRLLARLQAGYGHSAWLTRLVDLMQVGISNTPRY